MKKYLDIQIHMFLSSFMIQHKEENITALVASNKDVEGIKNMGKIINKNNSAAIGVGAMIVFIALIMVAGVAATILIRVSNSIQSQSLRTGEETIHEVAGGLAVYDVEGLVNKTGSTIYNMKYLAITIRLRPGSGTIDLNNSYILLTDGLKKVLLRYNYSNSSCFITKASASGSIFNLISTSNWVAVNKESFAIAVMQDFDGSIQRFLPMMNTGDKAILFVRCSSSSNGAFGRELPERTQVSGQVVPERGSPGAVIFTTPMSYADIIYDLQ